MHTIDFIFVIIYVIFLILDSSDRKKHILNICELCVRAIYMHQYIDLPVLCLKIVTYTSSL